MTEHTAGPWRVFEATLKRIKTRQFLIQPAEGHEHPDDFSDIIAEIPWQHFDDAEREANANLIAAAPALLAAAEEFVRKVDAGEARSTRSYAQFRAAISQARGEA